MSSIRNQVLLLTLCLALSACAHQKPFEPLAYETIADLYQVPQNAKAYEVGEVSEADQILIQREQKAFQTKFYAIWDRAKTITERTTIDEYLRTYDGKYGENLQPRTPEWFNAQIENSNLEALQSVNLKGIILHHADVRVLPTVFPCFDSPAQAGEGYPFDYLQLSQLYMGEPVLISHYSKDRAWVFVETNTEATGWVQAEKVALISKPQMAALKKKKLLLVTKDYSPIYLRNGRYWGDTRTGNALPWVRQSAKTVSVSIPIQKGERLIFENVELSKSVVLLRPLNFNSEDLSYAVDRFIGRPYGWGNVLGNRDCASMIKDFYALFHFLLPPLSRDQVKHGNVVVLRDEAPANKSLRILNEAKPFRTLLYKKGHIGIYAGAWKGQPILFHSTWGVKTKNGTQEGRNLVAKAAFTTLEPGKELPYFDKNKGNLLNSIESYLELNPPEIRATQQHPGSP